MAEANKLDNIEECIFGETNIMQTPDKNIQWLKKQKDFIKIRSIEIELNLPEGTLKKYVDDRRDLPETWRKVVSKWVEKFKK